MRDSSGYEQAFPSEYCHIEGAMAATLRLPLLIIAERGLANRGITWTGAGNPLLFMPNDNDTEWLNGDAFKRRLNSWNAVLDRRADVFLGYSSAAHATAQAVHLFLKEKVGCRVRNWKMDFAASGIIIDEVETAARLCSGGIFLFTKDDMIGGDDRYAAPRDNVIFEAGYFAAAKGRDRVLIIREVGAKMPADLGGSIYVSLADRNDISSIESAVRDFAEQRI
jgi:predicted nucleotide-binding protein